ncbi:MAG: twin-arginine translocation signal domain-containing protein, partial [Ignavibacteriae bacterium]|nr:twin-arginine translocation signal domain-containing protein [Ignavibacteriota bacterium]
MKSFNRRDFLKTAALTGVGLSMNPGLNFAEQKVKFQRSKPNG